jgi:hypothetical protein
MGGLLTSVILIEAGKVTLQVMGIHGFQKALANSLALLLLAHTHLVPPVRSATHATPSPSLPQDDPSLLAIGAAGHLGNPGRQTYVSAGREVVRLMTTTGAKYLLARLERQYLTDQGKLADAMPDWSSKSVTERG